MPELPEVETVRAGVDRWVVGRTVESVSVLHPRAVRRQPGGGEVFAHQVAGRRVTAARRRGKYLWLPLDDGNAVVGHLGMSGQLLVPEPDAEPEKHLRVQFEFADGGRQLRFVDQRTFGGLYVDQLTTEHEPAPEESAPGEPASAEPASGEPASEELGAYDGVPVSLAHIAPDPMESAFGDAEFVAGVRSRRTGVKRALLDQTLVSGIGNIYADEALWRARLHFARPTETLTRPVITELLAQVRAVLTEALVAGGTSFDSLYVDVNGDSGYFDRDLNVYGREGRECRRCGTSIRRDPFMNRSSFTCPRCQPRPRRARY